jgi:serine/threonine-protein kinase
MLAVVIKVCDGLAFAHNRGVLHCDVKPENIMVGSFGQAYLMDWGVACSLDERPKAAWLPVQIPARDDPALPLFRGGLNGTPAFMAPEQAFGYTHLVDERTDVFGLGAVLYTILLGRPPFRGSEMKAVISEARACAVTFPDDVDVSADASEPLAAALRPIVARAMARERHSRYQNVLDLQRALQAATDAAT